MKAKLILRRFWILIIFMVGGFYDYFENESISSLTGAIFTLVLLIALIRFKYLPPKILGAFFILISIWGIIDYLVDKEGIMIGKMLVSIGFLVLGLVYLLNKFDVLVDFIRTNRIFQIICVLLFLTYLFISVLRQQNVDLLEILILGVASVFGILILIPETRLILRLLLLYSSTPLTTSFYHCY